MSRGDGLGGTTIHISSDVTLDSIFTRIEQGGLPAFEFSDAIHTVAQLVHQAPTSMDALAGVLHTSNPQFRIAVLKELDLPADMIDQVDRIARTSDPEQQFAMLSRLVMDAARHPGTNVPLNGMPNPFRDPVGALPNETARVSLTSETSLEAQIRAAIERVGTGTPDNVGDILFQMRQSDNPAQVLETISDPHGITSLLARLADDPEHGEWASDLLISCGNLALPDLMDAAPNSPACQAIMRAIISGEPLLTAADTNADVDDLIAQLSTGSPQDIEAAAHLLYEMGDSAIPELQQAAESGTGQHRVIQSVIRSIIADDIRYVDESLHGNITSPIVDMGSNPYGGGDPLDSGSNTGVGIDFAGLLQHLRSPDMDTAMATLGMVSMMGDKAVPTLCGLLLHAKGILS